jgi:lipopolysaccharide transport system permease protein
MCGNTAWNYFATCLNGTSSTFVGNAGIFGKVYFPRLISPLSTVITSLLNFFIQLVMMIGFMIYFSLQGGWSIQPNWWLCLIPLLIIEMMALGMGFGIIISSLTTKYRDLNVLVGFGVSLWMYITPIIYSATNAESVSPTLRNIILLNPMAPIVETFRYAFLGTGQIPFLHLGISAIVTVVVLAIGVIIFSRVEKTFMDTV